MQREATGRLAGVRDLGGLRAVHGPGRITKAFLVVAAVIPVLTVGITLVEGGSGDSIVGAVTFGLLGALLMVAFALLLRPLRRVGVFDGGIAVAEWGRPRSWRWDDVVSLTSDVQKRTTTVYGAPVASVMAHRHKLRHTDGRRLTLTHGLRGVGDVIEKINTAVMPRIAAQAFETLRAGGTVAFGAVTLDPAGVHGKRRSVPWDRVAEPEIVAGVLTLRDTTSQTKPIVARCAKIVNLHALLMILHAVHANR